MKRLILTYSLNTLAVVSMALNGHALLLGPGDADFSGSYPKNPDAEDVRALTSTSAPLTLFYRAEDGVPTVTEEGLNPGSYAAAFEPAGDPVEAWITYTGGTMASGTPVFVVAKGGKHDTVWYIWNVTSMWNGTETLHLEGLWPTQGAISHVDIYQGPSVPAPEPGTMSLIGWSTLGFLLWRSRDWLAQKALSRT